MQHCTYGRVSECSFKHRKIQRKAPEACSLKPNELIPLNPYILIILLKVRRNRF